MTTRRLSRELADAIYQILVEECGSAPQSSHQIDFAYAFSERDEPPTEWWFGGDLGFGGKIYFDLHRDPPLWVGMYRENETPARVAMMGRANRRLAALWKEKGSIE